MQAIEIKYVGPSYKLGARLIATCATKRRVYGYGFLEGELDKRKIPHNFENLMKLACELITNELEWTASYGRYGRWISGQLKNGNWVFVNTWE